MILIFPTVVIGLEAVYGRSYGELLVLSTAAFTAFGLFALPSGWLADKWSRRNMIAVFFFGTGVCCVLVGLSESIETLAIALFGVGLFAAIYHPVGTPMVVDAAVSRGRTMAFNGICGNFGVSIASGSTAVIASSLGWRFTFFIPAVVFVLSGFAYLIFVPDTGRPWCGRRPGRGAEQRAHHRGGGPVPGARVLGRARVQRADHHAAEAGRAAGRLRHLAGHGRRVATRGVPLRRHGAIRHGAHGRTCGAAPDHVGDLGDSGRRHPARLWTSGWWLLPGLALAMAAIYGQVTVNDLVLARYTPPPGAGASTRSASSYFHDGGAGRMGYRPALRSRRVQPRARHRGPRSRTLGALNTFAIRALVSGEESSARPRRRGEPGRAAGGAARGVKKLTFWRAGQYEFLFFS